jgi:two-component system, NtrC family, sensor kinase
MENFVAPDPSGEQIAQAEKLAAIGHLAHGIAHELNTPLGVIISNLSVLKEYGDSLALYAAVAQQAATALDQGEAPALVAEKLRAAEKSADLSFVLGDLPGLAEDSAAGAQRMAAIVRSVATFAQRSTSEFTVVSVEEALDAASTLTSNELKQRGALVKHFAGVAPVMGQLGELTQVFVHLLLNAAQALEGSHGTITLETQQEADQVVVRVSDTGRGMTVEQSAQMFNPFYTTRPAGHGTGMGLAACHGIVVRHAGRIDVQSSVGVGTTMTVRLPVAASARAEAA